MGRRGQRGAASRHAAPKGHRPEQPAEPRQTLRGPGEGRADRRRAAKRIKRRKRLRATREVPLLIGVALLIALGLKTFLVQAFVIPSGSMEETIRIDDRVLVDKLTPWFGWEPERGDVVVFEDPGGWLTPEQQTDGSGPPVIGPVMDFLSWTGLLPDDDHQDLIKRVIGVGGDTVACCDDEGRVTVNGHPLNEPYLYPGNPPSRIEFEVTVPEGRIFVMGDHRSNSADSRYHLNDPHHGTVPVGNVLGRAVAVAWPFSHWQTLDDAEVFAAVPDPGAPRAGAEGVTGEKEIAVLPIPVELPVVMGVMSLLRIGGRPKRGVRSERGGCSGRRAVRIGRAGRGAPSPWRRGHGRFPRHWRRSGGRRRRPGRGRRRGGTGRPGERGDR
jgi:signal peptidase I